MRHKNGCHPNELEVKFDRKLRGMTPSNIIFLFKDCIFNPPQTKNICLQFKQNGSAYQRTKKGT